MDVCIKGREGTLLECLSVLECRYKTEVEYNLVIVPFDILLILV